MIQEKLPKKGKKPSFAGGRIYSPDEETDLRLQITFGMMDGKWTSSDYNYSIPMQMIEIIKNKNENDPITELLKFVICYINGLDDASTESLLKLNKLSFDELNQNPNIKLSKIVKDLSVAVELDNDQKGVRICYNTINKLIALLKNSDDAGIQFSHKDHIPEILFKKTNRFPPDLSDEVNGKWVPSRSKSK